MFMTTAATAASASAAAACVQAASAVVNDDKLGECGNTELRPGKGKRPLGSVVGGIGAVRVNDRSNLREWLAEIRDGSWKTRIRMGRATFLRLCDAVRDHSGFQMRATSTLASVEEQLFCTLYYLCSGSSYRSCAGTLGIPVGSLKNYSTRCITSIISLESQFIRFPTTVQEMDMASAEFEAIHRLPGCIGVVDGTHVNIITPRRRYNPANYDGFKGKSQNTQICCDAKGLITFVRPGIPGKVHDSPSLLGSSLFELRHLMVQRGKYLIADAGYALSSWIVTPFKETAMEQDARKRQYNRFLCGRRAIIERVNGHLKGRFRILSTRCPIASLESLRDIMRCCCILHNFCCLAKDILDDDCVRNEAQSNASDNSGTNSIELSDEHEPLSASEESRQGRTLRDTLIHLFNTVAWVGYTQTLKARGHTYV